MTTLQITTLLEPAGPAAAILLTDEQVAQLGPTKNPPVLVTIGERSARLRLARMGGKNMIGLSKKSRTDLAVEIGDTVTATIALDAAERTVEIPAVLASVLDENPECRKAFEALSYTKRKEIARSISEAKQEVTQQRRIDRVLADLR